MSDGTGIAWTDATWNPIRGCSRVSKGCMHCYAETVANRFNGPGAPYEGLTTAGKWNGTIRVVENAIDQPLRWKRPRRIFVNSMSDLFHENVSDETITRIFVVMQLAQHHTFQVLTKRPERMLRWFGWLRTEEGKRVWLKHVVSTPDSECESWSCAWPFRNVWLGVSVEDQATADERIPLLLQTPAAVRFISAEPLLGPIDLKNIASAPDEMMLPLAGLTWGLLPVNMPPRLKRRHAALDWVIVGGESGRGARACDVPDVRAIVHDCHEAKVPCFVKQLGAHPFDICGCVDMDGAARLGGCARCGGGDVVVEYAPKLKDRKGATPSEWEPYLQVQQYPEVRA